MKRSSFTEEQIIGILKEHQAGMSASELCRKHGISDATLYNWRSKYGGMEVSKAKRLEEEYAKLKRLLAEQKMHVATLREMLGKNFLGPVEGGEGWVGHWSERHPERRDPGRDREGLLTAPRLPSGGHRPACPSITIQPPRRCKAADALAGTVR